MRRTTKASQPLKSKIEVPWDTTGVINADSDQTIPLDQISLPPNQPRRYFDPEALKQLTESIKQHGILQPLLVRPLDGEKHELVAGERRYRAAQEIGLQVVPVVIRELDDNAAFQLALIENLLREDLNPVEETEGILQLLALKLGRSIEDIPPLLRRLQHERKVAANSSNNVIGKPESASDNTVQDDVVKDESENLAPDNNVIGSQESDSEKTSNNVIGKDENHEQQGSPLVNPDLEVVEKVFEGLGLMTWESFANNRLPLLNLPEDILDVLREGSLEYTKAKAIAQIQKLDERVAFLAQAIANNWSLSEIRQRISEKKVVASTPDTDSNNYKERFTAATTKLRKSRIWSDPKKRKQIEKLLSQLEALTSVE
ncbi:ParB/RepB/Spo0J family partition protein [Nostoc parmelioides]|uniref:ParB/RepB/Spo0J family partition protein n=1 Tax=Nostoc parmelioides FACHB-3921 TaxID=2692909 RepID=A0ABR8BP99_9NOSO|nr:ParB/RepB/Spo0J family partition protein [Nostoc parmelioides]MBD2255771.1 ParB/RepB/Spo0J family partition protein [Nostoc parmelioides FACHB-3921]